MYDTFPIHVSLQPHISLVFYLSDKIDMFLHHLSVW